MGSGGGGTSENLNPPTVRRTPVRERGGLAAAKMSEVGVSYRPSRGMSPAAARAITGSDVAAANIAGRPDINVAQLGDLQTRAATGTRGIQGTLLNTIGRASATRLMTAISQDTPTIGAGGQVQYSVDPVTDPRTGAIVGVTQPGPFEGSRVYSGRPDMAPTAMTQRDDLTPLVTPEVTPEVVPDDAGNGVIMDASVRGRGRGDPRRTRAGKLLAGAASFESLLGGTAKV